MRWGTIVLAFGVAAATVGCGTQHRAARPPVRKLPLGTFARLELHDDQGRAIGPVVFRQATEAEASTAGGVDTFPGQVTVLTPGHSWRRIVIAPGTCRRTLSYPSDVIAAGRPSVTLSDGWGVFEGRRWAVQVFAGWTARVPAACAEHPGASPLAAGGSSMTDDQGPPPTPAADGSLRVDLAGGGGDTSVVRPSAEGFTVHTTLAASEEVGCCSHDGPLGQIRAGSCTKGVAGERPIPLSDPYADEADQPLVADDTVHVSLARLLRTPHVIEYFDGNEGFRRVACGMLSR